MEDEDVWFEPKRYGYGAGLPVAWQGWVLLGGYVGAVLLGSAFVTPRSPLAFIIFVILLTVALMAISARHTRGGWRWRWGGD